MRDRISLSFQGRREGLPRLFALLCALIFCACLAGCGGGEEPLYKPTYSASTTASSVEYIFAPHPVMNAQKLAEVYGAMLGHINRQLAADGIRLKLEASRSYAVYNEKLLRRELHFSMPNPYQTVLALDCGYEIFGKVDNDENFRGIILLRKDSPIKSVQELKGSVVSFPAPTALAATMMPELYFKEHGLDPRTEISPLFVGTHDSAMLNVAIGRSVAACTSPRAWAGFQQDRPDMAKLIEVRWQTPYLPNNGLVVRNDVPEQVRCKVAQAFFSLDKDSEGRRILGMANSERFVPADNATFAPVYEFIRRYTKSVRELKGLHE